MTYSYDFFKESNTDIPLLPHAIALISLSFKISASKFTVEVLPFVPVIHINFDVDSFEVSLYQ